MATPRAIRDLTRLQCKIFQTSYNPTSIRTGRKYLTTRLRGPTMVNYYPEMVNFATIKKLYPDLEIVDEDEEQRLQDIIDRRKRGKGAPKKLKEKREEGKKAGKKGGGGSAKEKPKPKEEKKEEEEKEKPERLSPRPIIPFVSLRPQ